jgi:antitoxin ParD1/3/4
MQKKTIDISVPQSMAEYIEHEVASGEFASTSDFFRTLVREHQSRRGRTGDDLRGMIREGLESGESTLLGSVALSGAP